MRFKISILLSLLLLAVYTMSAISADWESDSPSADDLIAGGDQGTYKFVGTELNLAAKASRDAQTKTKEASTPVVSQNVTALLIVPNDTAQKQSGPLSVSGVWYLEFGGSTIRNATLTLFQSGGAIFGKGVIAKGNSTLTAAAGGSVLGDEIDMDLVSLEEAGLVRISMKAAESSAAGDFTAFSTTAPSFSGTVNGVRL